MIPALAALLVFAAAPATGGKPPAPEGAKVQKRTLDNASVDELLTAATALTLDRSLDDAQKAIELGRSRYPAAQGFHLKQADLLLVRGRTVDAFYEYLWEVMRAGRNDTGAAAAKAIGGLIKDGARGTEVDEMQRVLIAQANLMVKSRDSLDSLKKIQTLRGNTFALRVLISEAQVVAGELDSAETGFRALIADDRFFVPAYVELAGVLRLKGNSADADALDAKAREIYPEHPSITSPLRLAPATPAPVASPAR